jgi:hypothetical protein
VKRGTEFDRQTFAAGHTEPFGPLMAWPARAELRWWLVEIDGE